MAWLAVLLLGLSLQACGGKKGDADEDAVHTGHQGMEGMSGMEGMQDMKEMQGMASTQADTGLDAVLRSPGAFVLADLDITNAVMRAWPDSMAATGTIQYDPRSARTVSARAAGWVEKLYVNYRYQPVVRGQKLMDLYSRELVTEQENYLLLLRQQPLDAKLSAAAEKRLSLLGLSDEGITALRTQQRITRTIPYYSPATGILQDIDGSTSAASSNMAMNGTDASVLILREGAYVEKGQTLFAITTTSTVLALLNILPAEDPSRITVGQPVIVRIDEPGGDVLRGRVDLIEPLYREGTAFTTVRCYLPNPGSRPGAGPDGRLRIGSRITATIATGARNALAVPATAVVSTGLHHYVFVKEAGGFRARQIEVGSRSPEWTEIRAGLSQQEAIARNAQLLIDSESFLNATKP